MSNENLGFLIGLPPKKAIEYFKSKGYTFSWNWHDTWQEAHSKAFTVAKVAQMDVLMDIRKMVQESIDKGLTFRQFQKELEPELKKKGWWGKQTIDDKEVQLGSPYRLRTIYNENLSTSHAAGRYKAMINNVDNRPFWQYWTMDDNRVRPAHARLHGKVFPASDPFWDTFYPPNDWGDRCSVRALSERDLKRRGLIPETSEGTLSTEEKSVSKNSDIKRPVSVYTDPVTGEKTATGPGWSYNPGKASWKPDLSKYPQSLVKQYAKEKASATIIKQGGDTGKFNLHKLPGWKYITGEDTEEEKIEKIKENLTSVETIFKEKLKEIAGKEITAKMNFKNLTMTEEKERELGLGEFIDKKGRAEYRLGYYDTDTNEVYVWSEVLKKIALHKDIESMEPISHEYTHGIVQKSPFWLFSKKHEEALTSTVNWWINANHIEGFRVTEEILLNDSYFTLNTDTLMQIMSNPEYNTSEKIFGKLLRLRKIEWKDSPDLKQLEAEEKEAYDFIDKIKLKEEDLPQEEYNSFLQGILKNDIINKGTKEKINSYLEENNERAIEERKRNYQEQIGRIAIMQLDKKQEDLWVAKTKEDYRISPRGDVLVNRDASIEIEVLKCYLQPNRQ